jgi:hypothetical protein
MSTIVCLKEKNTVVLGTDSRFMKHDFSGVASDAEQKIFGIAPETFIAPSGRKMACDFQHAKARELAEDMGTADIETIGAALKRESLPVLRRLIKALRSIPEERARQAISGESLLHGCVLVGRNAAGQLGFVAHLYRVQGGKVACEVDAHFEDNRKIFFTSGVPPENVMGLVGRLKEDLKIWTDRPVSAVQRILAEIKRSTVESGGLDQVVCLDRRGARWISRPPKAAIAPVDNLGSATINAAILLTAPSIDVASGSTRLQLDGTNYLLITDTVTTTSQVQVKPGSLIVTSTSSVAAAGALLDAGGQGILRAKDSGGNTVDIYGTNSGTANAGAATLPANPVGFLEIKINGTARKIPYYAN